PVCSERIGQRVDDVADIYTAIRSVFDEFSRGGDVRLDDAANRDGLRLWSLLRFFGRDGSWCPSIVHCCVSFCRGVPRATIAFLVRASGAVTCLYRPQCSPYY